VTERIKLFAPAHVSDQQDLTRMKPVHMSAMHIAEQAMEPRLLSRMDPTWHPWF
jgi:hypothetical protein